MYNINLDPGIYNLGQLKINILNANATPDNWQLLTQELDTMSATEVWEITQQIEGVTPVINEMGEVTGAMYITKDAGYAAMSELEAAAAAGAINSNTVNVATKTAEVMLPQNATVNATTGAVEMAGGATRVAGAGAGSKVATVAGHVGTWVVGASIGMKLGVWINNLAYNANPDFWDSGKIPLFVNPELWKTTKITNWLYDYSGYDDFMAMVGDDGQLYVDENTLAVMAQYLAAQGVFSDKYKSVELDDQSPLFNNDYIMPVRTQPLPFNLLQWGVNNYPVTTQNETAPVYAAIFGNADNNVQYYVASTGPFDLVVPGLTQSATPVTRNGITYYELETFADYSLLPGMVRNVADPDKTNRGWDLMYMLEHGIVTEYGKEGFNPYAPMPEGITPDMTGQQIIDLLKDQYPEIWNPTDPNVNGPIKQGVLQPDGTITDKIYIPVPTPDGGREGQPETTPQTPEKPDPENETSTKTIIKIVQPTPTPTPPTPDTGEGKTPVPVLPTGSADALYKIYNPTNAQVQAFGAWLWSSNFVDQLLKVFSDPMQAIISLHKIYATPHIGGETDIKVGYLNSGVRSNYVDQQYIDVDCGSVSILETSGNVFDYDPYTDIRIYLPFIGIVKLDTADVMRGVVNVKYRVDVITGTVVAFVSITRDAGAGGVIYQYTGSMAEIYPLSSGSYMGIVTGVLGIAAGIAGTIMSGGAAAPALLGGAAGMSAMHTKVEHSNGFSGNAGALAAKKPYIIISKAQSAMSNGIGQETGWPTNYFARLSQCSGYTRIKSIHLSGIIGATDTELEQIETLLKQGVII